MYVTPASAHTYTDVPQPAAQTYTLARGHVIHSDISLIPKFREVSQDVPFLCSSFDSLLRGDSGGSDITPPQNDGERVFMTLLLVAYFILTITILGSFSNTIIDVTRSRKKL